MSAETPAAGGEQKSDIKAGGNKPFQNHGARNNYQRRDNNYHKKEKFLGADPDLQGFAVRTSK